MERVDMVNVTGRATLDYFGSPTSSVRTSATYGSLHAATGRPIFVDTGFDASEVKDHGWLTADVSVINERISDGVVAVHVDNATSDMQTRISALSTTLQALSPAPQTGCAP
jgi:hypothetical protein